MVTRGMRVVLLCALGLAACRATPPAPPLREPPVEAAPGPETDAPPDDPERTVFPPSPPDPEDRPPPVMEDVPNAPPDPGTGRGEGKTVRNRDAGTDLQRR
jgi:hypothetical protein